MAAKSERPLNGKGWSVNEAQRPVPTANKPNLCVMNHAGGRTDRATWVRSAADGLVRRPKWEIGGPRRQGGRRPK
jgi:hypothetical protein